MSANFSGIPAREGEKNKESRNEEERKGMNKEVRGKAVYTLGTDGTIETR